MSLNITDVQITPTTGTGKLRGFVKLTVDSVLVLEDWRVIEGSRGLFLASPSKKTDAGEWRDTMYVVNREAREALQSQVLDVYHQLTVNKQTSGSSSNTKSPLKAGTSSQKSQIPQEYEEFVTQPETPFFDDVPPPTDKDYQPVEEDAPEGWYQEIREAIVLMETHGKKQAHGFPYFY